MSALAAARIRARPHDPAATTGTVTAARTSHSAHAAGHHHAPTPVALRGELAEGAVEIVDTPDGERMQFTASRAPANLDAIVEIERDHGRVETLVLAALDGDRSRFMSSEAPQEPNEFDARLRLRAAGHSEVLRFRMLEPEGHPVATSTASHEH